MAHKERVCQWVGYIFRLKKRHIKIGFTLGKNDEKHQGRGINGKRGTFNNGTQWEKAWVYRRFPRVQKSMWLFGASVLIEALQGNCCESLWGKLL